MKYKDFQKKYQDYSIEVFGRPLDTPTIPFTFLPNDKPLDECEVIDYKIQEKEHVIFGYRFKDLKPIKPEHKKGYVRVYVK